MQRSPENFDQAAPSGHTNFNRGLYRPRILRKSGSSCWCVILPGKTGSAADNAARGPLKVSYKCGEDHLPRLQIYSGASQAGFCHRHQIWENADLAVGKKQIISMESGPRTAHSKPRNKPISPGKIVYQPKYAGTLPAVYIALAFILAREPAARVMILAGQQLIFPADKFAELSRHAFQYAAEVPDQVFLAGTVPNEYHHHNDWIEWQSQKTDNESGSELTNTNLTCAKHYPVLNITNIYNNPRPGKSGKLSGTGALWNANIVVARASLLWCLLSKRSPELFDRFAYVNNVISHFAADAESQDYINSAISHTFYEMPTLDFAKEIVWPHLRQCRVIPIQDVSFSQCGNKRPAGRGLVKGKGSHRMTAENASLA